MTERLDFTGKVAVITGSSRGWGFGIAQELAARGATIVVNGTTDASAEKAATQIRAAGGTCLAVGARVSESVDATKLIDATIDAFGRIDILVNNAGATQPGMLVDLTDQQWHEVVAIQLNAQFYTCRAAARHMIAAGRGGRIVNMTAGSGFSGMYGNSSHAASKSGGIAATVSWALELAGHGITVNGVAGQIDTDQARPYLDSLRDNLRKAGRPHDFTNRDFGFYPATEMAAIVVWLCSDRAAKVNGQFFHANGPELQMLKMGSVIRQLFNHDRWTPEGLDAMGIARIAEPAPLVDPLLSSNPVIEMGTPGIDYDA